jgi:hypothetical protein
MVPEFMRDSGGALWLKNREKLAKSLRKIEG